MKRLFLLSALVLMLIPGMTQAENSRPQNTSDTTNTEVVFKSPGEGRYTFNFNEAFPDENNVMFSWSPKTVNAVLLIKSDDKILDEITVENTSHIKLNLSKYSSHRSLAWSLIIDESEDVLKGIIDLRKYRPRTLFNF
jgi:hypothetical protein